MTAICKKINTRTEPRRHHLSDWRIRLQTILYLCSLLGSAGVSAQVSGTLTGVLLYTDTRQEGVAGSSHPVNHPGPGASGGGLVTLRPLRGVGVRVVTEPFELPDGSFTAPNSHIAKTDSTGRFVIDWFDDDIQSFPLILDVKISLCMSRLEDGEQRSAFGLSTGGCRFTISGGAFLPTQLLIDKGVSIVTIRDKVEVLGPTSTTAPTTYRAVLKPSNAVAAYMTAEEVFRRVIDGENTSPVASPQGSELLQERMPSLSIFHAASFMSGGVAPTRKTIFLAPGCPFTHPARVAHEIGHVIAWNAFDLDRAAILPGDYLFGGVDSALALPVTFGGLSNTFVSEEGELVAWNEAFADFIAVLWNWRYDIDPTIPLGGFVYVHRGSVNPEFGDPSGTGVLARSADGTIRPAIPDVCFLGPPPGGGETSSQQQRKVACQMLALWDLIDQPNLAGGVDDDAAFWAPPAHLDFSEMVEIMDSYPDNCPPFNNDGCSNEPGPHGLNHWDFFMSAIEFRPDLEDPIIEVYTLNNILLGDGRPF